MNHGVGTQICKKLNKKAYNMMNYSRTQVTYTQLYKCWGGERGGSMKLLNNIFKKKQILLYNRYSFLYS